MALVPLLARPTIVLGLCGAAVVAVLATRSVAYPVALAAAPEVLIGLIGHNPFPNGAVALMVFAWTAVAIIFATMGEADALPMRALTSGPVLLTFALVLLLLVRLSVSGDQQFGSFKLRLFVAQNLTGLLAGIVIGRRRRDFNLLVTLLLAMAALSAIVLVRQLVSGHAATLGGRFSLYESQSPIGLAREAATGLIIAAYMLLSSRRASIRLLALAAAPVIAVAFVSTGSRGPVLGLIIGSLVLLVLTLREPGTRGRVLLVALGGIAAAVLVTQLVPGQNITRSFSFLFGSGTGLSSNGRFTLWGQAWSAFLAHPIFGIGTGGFAQLAPSELYPHNIFLEAAAEFGVVGLVLITGIIVLGGLTLIRQWSRSAAEDRTQAALATAMFAAAFMNALISGDFPGNDFLWVTIGLGIGLKARATAAEHAPAEPELTLPAWPGTTQSAS